MSTAIRSGDGHAAPYQSNLILPAKGHLQPHVSHLPRRRKLPRPTTQDSNSTNELAPSSPSSGSSSSCSSSSSESLEMSPHAPSLHARSPSPSTSSQSSPSYPRPCHAQPQHQHHTVQPIGHLQPLVSNVPRRPRPVQVLPGSGIYSIPPIDSRGGDDSGVPSDEFRYKGESGADILARALFFLCTSEAEWHEGLVEGVYMRLHDLGMVPSPWMGALRREGLFVVEDQLKRTMSG